MTNQNLTKIKLLNKKNNPLYPNRISINLHNLCDFKCKICKIWESKNKKIMSIKDAHNVINQISEFNKKIKVQFIGGETLLYKNLFDLLKYAKYKGLNSSIVTHAFHLDKNIIIELSDAGLEYLDISLDSIDQKTHNYIRGINNSYQKIFEVLKLIKKYAKFDININTVICSLNLHELSLISNFVKNNDILNRINFIVFDKPYMSNYNDNWTINSPASYLWPNDKNIITNEFNKLIEFKKKNPNIINNSIKQLEYYKQYYINSQIFLKKFGCKTGYTNATIDIDSNLRLCTRNDDIAILGNLKKDNLSNLWNSRNANNIRTTMLECKQNCVEVLSCGYIDE